MNLTEFINKCHEYSLSLLDEFLLKYPKLKSDMDAHGTYEEIKKYSPAQCVSLYKNTPELLDKINTYVDDDDKERIAKLKKNIDKI